MQGLDNLSRDEKIRLIMMRFKTVKDLHTYMSEHLNFLLPPYKSTRLSHLQDILYEKKKVLLLSDVSAKKVPSWPELSLKRCFALVTDSCPEILNYLPEFNENKPVDRDFFWQVTYTLCPNEVDAFIEETEKARKKQPNLQDQKFKVGISDGFLD